MDKKKYIALITKQLNNFWDFEMSEVFYSAMERAMERFKLCSSALTGVKELTKEEIELNPYHTVQYGIFLYYLSNELGRMNSCEDAAKVYYLNKIMHGVDWYFEIKLPVHFWAEHPIGGVLGRAQYGDYFFVYQGVTVGGNPKDDIIYYPTLGNRVIMYANSMVIGKSNIGNNVILASNTYVKDENIPDYSIVFGRSPNLVVKRISKEEMEKRVSHIWQERK